MKNSIGLFVALASTLSASGCRGVDDISIDVFPDDLRIDLEPSVDRDFEIDVELAADTDPGTVKVGLFRRAGAPNELDLVDGGVLEGSITLDILATQQGRPQLEYIWNADEADVAAARVYPETLHDIVASRVSVALPEVADYAAEDLSNDLLIIAWIDADGDGALRLTDDDTRELARAPVREFAWSEGYAPAVLHAIFPVFEETEREMPVAWGATGLAWAPNEDEDGPPNTYAEARVEADESTGWTIRLR